MIIRNLLSYKQKKRFENPTFIGLTRVGRVNTIWGNHLHISNRVPVLVNISQLAIWLFPDDIRTTFWTTYWRTHIRTSCVSNKNLDFVQMFANTENRTHTWVCIAKLIFNLNFEDEMALILFSPATQPPTYPATQPPTQPPTRKSSF